MPRGMQDCQHVSVMFVPMPCYIQDCQHVLLVLVLMPCGIQDCVYGAIALQGADQGLCFLTSAAHDSWSRPCQHYVHA